MTSNSYNNILIIKPSALGDIVHALPVLPSLRAAFPDAKLTWLVRKEFAPLLECTTGLDEILLFDRKGMGNWFYSPKGFGIFWDFAKKLRAGGYDLVLDLQGLCRSAIFARMTGCGRRVGMTESRELAHLFYTEQVQRPTDSVHILDYYFEVIRSIGVNNPLGDCPLAAPAAAKAAIEQKLNQHELTPDAFAVLIPGSAHGYKCWPTGDRPDRPDPHPGTGCAVRPRRCGRRQRYRPRPYRRRNADAHGDFVWQYQSAAAGTVPAAGVHCRC